jgi:HTH-type transcriptional regulator/antitoxin HigA
MRIKTRKTDTAGSEDRYLDLVRQFPLRPIRSKSAYAEANRIHHSLLLRDAELDQEESDYATLLGRLIRDYDELHATVLRDRRRGTPIELLRFLMEQHGMKTTHLGELVGGRGQASLILSGKRELSKANIRTLATRFHVSPALFL